MKILARRILLASAIVIVSALPTVRPSAGPVLELRPRNDKLVVLDCNHGWQASAVGQYGGVGISLSCKNGKDRARIAGTVGTAYSIRVEGQTDVGIICFFTGDASSVNEACGNAVSLTIR